MKQSTLLYKSSRWPRLYYFSLFGVVLPVLVGILIFKDLDLDVFFEEYRSRVLEIIWMVTMLIFSNLIWIYMLWVSGRYIMKIEVIDEKTIAIKTWSVTGLHKTRNYPKEILNIEKFTPRKTVIWEEPNLNATYTVIKTNTGKKLLLDKQGEFFAASKVNKY